MKLFALLFLSISLIYGAYIDEFASNAGYLRDYNASIELAKKEHKLVMLVVVADFCPWCKKLERKTLLHEDVAKKVEENCVGVVFDKNWDDGNFPKEFSSATIPSIYFINPENQKEIYQLSSYINHKKFSDLMDEALKIFRESKK